MDATRGIDGEPFLEVVSRTGGGEARVQSMLGQNVKELATKSDRERWQGQ